MVNMTKDEQEVLRWKNVTRLTQILLRLKYNRFFPVFYLTATYCMQKNITRLEIVIRI